MQILEGYHGVSGNEFPDNYHYHILIHFKRKIRDAPGSAEFDLSKQEITERVLKPYNDCLNIQLEDRDIHPLNIDRTSICGTPLPLSKLFPDIQGPKSQIYDKLLRDPTSTKNIAKKLLKEKPCPISKHISEGFNVYKWTIALIAAAVIVYFILINIPGLAVNKEAISLLVGLVGLAIALWKLKH